MIAKTYSTIWISIEQTILRHDGRQSRSPPAYHNSRGAAYRPRRAVSESLRERLRSAGAPAVGRKQKSTVDHEPRLGHGARSRYRFVVEQIGIAHHGIAVVPLTSIGPVVIPVPDEFARHADVHVMFVDARHIVDLTCGLVLVPSFQARLSARVKAILRQPIDVALAVSILASDRRKSTNQRRMGCDIECNGAALADPQHEDARCVDFGTTGKESDGMLKVLRLGRGIFPAARFAAAFAAVARIERQGYETSSDSICA